MEFVLNANAGFILMALYLVINGVLSIWIIDKEVNGYHKILYSSLIWLVPVLGGVLYVIKNIIRFSVVSCRN